MCLYARAYACVLVCDFACVCMRVSMRVWTCACASVQAQTRKVDGCDILNYTGFFEMFFLEPPSAAVAFESERFSSIWRQRNYLMMAKSPLEDS